jgi:hypothetical protein
VKCQTCWQRDKNKMQSCRRGVFTVNCVEDTFRKLQGLEICIRKTVFTWSLNPGRGKMICSSADPPDRLWGPPSRLFRGTKGCFPGRKATEAWDWPLVTI